LSRVEGTEIHVGKSDLFYTSIHSSGSLLVLSLGVMIFNMFDSILKLSGKKYNLALHWAEMDPDRQAFDACRSCNNTGLM
jgi:hypothetical protein